MKRFAIPVVCRKRKLLRTFQSHALRVHVTLPLSCERRDAKVIEGFLLVAEDLRTFIRLLQTWNLAHGACLDTKLNIRLEKALSLKNQKHLLEPFRGLVALPGYVRIGGSVDHGYAKDLCQHIMPPVRWARASGWLCYDLALWLAKFGNAALRAKKYTLAETKYWDCLSLFQSARESHAGLEEVEDDDLALAIGDLISACSTNRALATLLYKDVDIEWKAATAMDFTSHYDFESRYVSLLSLVPVTPVISNSFPNLNVAFLIILLLGVWGFFNPFYQYEPRRRVIWPLCGECAVKNADQLTMTHVIVPSPLTQKEAD